MRARVCMLMLFVLSLLGCGPGHVVSENPSQTLTWLASEIETKYTQEFAFEFPVRNKSSQSAEFRVRSSGCSCYEVGLGDKSLKVGDPFSVEPGGVALLRLRPPKPAPSDSRTFTFSVEHLNTPDKQPLVMQFTAFHRVVRELQVSSQVILQEFAEDTPSLKARVEVTRWSRTQDEVNEPPVFENWPEGSVGAVIEPLGPATDSDGVWKRSYKSEITVPRPNFEQGDIRYLQTVRGSKPELQVQLQLVQRLISGVGAPSLVHFGETKVGVPVTRRIQLSAHDDRPFLITGTENESISITPDRTVAQPRHWALLTWTAQEPGELKQKLLVKTDHPQKPVVEIEVLGQASP